MTPPRNPLSRRAFLGTSAAGLALAARTARAQKKQPNVLFIQPDQHRGTILGCAGDARAHTPNLDRLAAEGTHFTHCASSSPVCSPCRGSYQTGLYPCQHGVTSNNLFLDPPETTYLAEIFRDAGYATGYIGKWHLDGDIPNGVGGYIAPGVRRRGYEEWSGYEKAHEYFEVWRYDESKTPPEKVRVAGYDWEPTWQTDRFLDFAKRACDAGKPFMYYLAYGPPHLPEQCPQALLDKYPPDSFMLPPDVAGKFDAKTEAVLRKSLQTYYGQVEALDIEVGRVLDGLKALGEDENTIILYTSDHGDLLGSHAKPGKLRGKASPYATAFRIPCILRWPGGIPAGQRSDAPVSSVDLPPTLLDLAGLPIPWKMQGDSMAGWCRSGTGVRNEGVYIALGDWKAVWDGRWVYCPSESYRILYDHQTDPHEMVNRFDDPACAAEQARLEALLGKLTARAETLPARPTKA